MNIERSEPLEIDTKGMCLLCLTPCVSPTPTSLSSAKGFKQLLRYLRVNTTELFNCSQTFLASMDIQDNIDVQISLCSKCTLVTEDFDKFYREYEMLRIRFDNCVHSVYTLISDGDQSPERVREYKRRMKPVKTVEIVNASIAANLRSETFKKCSSKLNARIPRVSLSDVGTLVTPSHIPEEDLKPFMAAQNAFCSTLGLVRNDLVAKPTLIAKPVPTSEPQSGLNNSVIMTPTFNTESLCNQFNDLINPQPSVVFSLSNAIRASTRHVPNTTGDGTVPSCRHCNRIFGKRGSLNDHIVLVHTYEMLTGVHLPHHISPQLLRDAWNHVLSESKLDSNSFQCQHCQMTFSETRRLKLHLVRFHIDGYIKSITDYVDTSGTLPDDPTSILQSLNASMISLAPLSPPPPVLSPPPPPPPSDDTRCIKCKRSFGSRRSFNSHFSRCRFAVKGVSKSAKINRRKIRNSSHRYDPASCQYCGHITNYGEKAIRRHCVDVHFVEMIMEKIPEAGRDTVKEAVKMAFKDMMEKGGLCFCGTCIEDKRKLRNHVVSSHFDEFITHLNNRMQHGELSAPDSDDEEMVEDSLYLDGIGIPVDVIMDTGVVKEESKEPENHENETVDLDFLNANHS